VGYIGEAMSEQAPDPEPGARFSLFYRQRGEPTEDSERMRHRIGAAIASNDWLNHNNFKHRVEHDIGIDAPWAESWPPFVKKLALNDVLDLITVAAEYLRDSPAGSGELMAQQWVAGINRIFREENVHYRVEPKGGVRFYIDEAFSQARTATITALSAPRYANAIAEFEKGMASLAKAPPDGKGAIRDVFAAAEAIFRLITGKDRLGASELDALLPILERLYAQQETALRSARKMLASFKDWVDAAHFYRHEEGYPEPTQPPLQLAIYIVDSGSAHIRWLAEIDGQNQQRQIAS
jgi:hypothetical protein